MISYLEDYRKNPESAEKIIIAMQERINDLDAEIRPFPPHCDLAEMVRIIDRNKELEALIDN